MISVERIERVLKIKQEPKSILENDKNLVKSWPSNGNIEFKNVFMKYNDTNQDYILKGLSFSI